MTDHIATAQTTINAPAEQVWQALTDPRLIKQYMFGSEVRSDWEEGSPITWSGQYDGKSYQDKGTILEVIPRERLRMTHYSPMSGQPDEPASYHTLVYDLRAGKTATEVTLSQDGNGSLEEAEHSQATWQSMLDGLKELVETT